MERLTKKDRYGHYYTNVKVYDRMQSDEKSPHAYDGKAIDKLAEYEDAEEKQMILPAPLDGVDCFIFNGIWQRVPCKVGDTVYRISDNYNLRGKYIEETTVSRIAIDDEGIYVFCSCKSNAKRKFGKNVFYTKEEAEQKLKEMDGD